MKVAFLSIGDELLIGQTVNTNASWLGQQFSLKGFEVSQVATIRDDADAIVQAIDNLRKDSNLILVTGGLGPTKDDITKMVLCEYFNTELEMNNEVLKEIEAFFSSVNRPMLQVNIDQALLPKDATILKNEKGTAAGMWFEQDDLILVSMPGVPYEMKHLVLDRVLPRLEERFDLASSYYETVLTQGIGESFLAERIAEIEDDIRLNGFGLAYLPSPGYVRLRITGPSNDDSKKKIRSYIESIEALLPNYCFGRNEDTLSAKLGELLLSKSLSLSTVESCTGGKLAAELVKVSGASAYFLGGLLTYSNELKSKLAFVSEESLNNFGAVSEEVVREMAIGGRKQCNSDYCISVSGIAGPTGGSEEKPVGTVWIAIQGPNSVLTKRFQFGNDRQLTIEKTVATALNMLRCMISEINFEKSN